MRVADADAIRRAVDSPIGENLTRQALVGRVTPCAPLANRRPACRGLPALPNPLPRVSQKKHTSNATEACVLNANEEKRSIVASAPYHGLCVGSDVTDGALLRGSSREPVGGAPAEIVCSRRAVDRAARPNRGGRNCRDWGHCYSGLAGVRRAISGGTAAARRDNRLPTTAKRILCSGEFD